MHGSLMNSTSFKGKIYMLCDISLSGQFVSDDNNLNAITCNYFKYGSKLKITQLRTCVAFKSALEFNRAVKFINNYTTTVIRKRCFRSFI